MRITLDESEMEGSRRKHALGTTEQFESIDEVVTYLEARLREVREGVHGQAERRQSDAGPRD